MAAKEIVSLANCNTAFGLDMFKQLAADSKESNIFFSPYSIYSALAMVSLGAKNETLKQLRKAMKLEDFPEEQTHVWFAELNEMVLDNGQKCTLHSANRLYGEKSYNFLEEFLEDCQMYYGAELAAIDFKCQPDVCRSEINAWVSMQTRDRINDLLPKYSIDGETRLILVNAIYFKGDWKQKFQLCETRELDFHVGPNDSVKVQMMHIKKDYFSFGYSEKLCCQFVALPYIGESVSMFVLLPDLKKTSLEEMERSLSVDSLNEFVARKRELNLWLPRFKMEEHFDVEDALKRLGAGDMFARGTADLSGMDGTRDLYVSKAVHRAFIEVNEKGSETGVAARMAKCLSEPTEPPEFKADHPFVFFLRDNKTSTVLFCGRLLKP